MAGTVWFGTKEHMQWVPAPAVDVAAGKVGHSSVANFLSGGAYVRRSKGAAKKYSFSWTMRRRSDVQAILDYADGLYGNGYIYYSNPFAMDRNVMPSAWATPFINCYDGPVVINNIRPALVNTGSVINGYPIESAQYTITSTDSVPSIYIPIPPGYTAHVGAHGSVISGAANVTITEHVTPAGGPTSNLTLLDKTDALTNKMTSGNSYQGITISMSSGSTGVLQLDGIIVQVLPDGSVAPTGAFVSGQGQSGMSFTSEPVTSEYSAALDRVGVSADLIETEAYQWQ